MQNKEWFYLQAGQQTGPVSTEEILNLAKAGRLRGNDSLWKAGLPQWVPLQTLPEFASAVAQLPPAAPAAPKSGWPLWVKIVLGLIALGVVGLIAIFLMVFSFIFNTQKVIFDSFKDASQTRTQTPSLISYLDVEGTARRAGIPVGFVPREFQGHQLEFIKTHEASGLVTASYVGPGKIDLRVANKHSAEAALVQAASLKELLGAGLEFKESGKNIRFSSAFSAEKKHFVTVWTAGNFAFAATFPDRETGNRFINPYVKEIVTPQLSGGGN